MSDLFGAIAEGINQDKGMIYGLVNNAISYAQSKKAQKRAFQYASALQQQQNVLQKDLNKYGWTQGPSYARQGLESAGFNPMLAVQGSGASGYATGSIAGGSPVGSNAPDSPNLAGNALDIARLNNETAQTESNVQLQAEQSETEQAKRENFSFQNAMLDVEKHLKQEDLDHYERRFYAEIYEAMQRAENYRAQASVAAYNADSQRIIANAQKTSAETGNPWKLGSSFLGKVKDKFDKWNDESNAKQRAIVKKSYPNGVPDVFRHNGF